ncbi:MAG: septum formation initiator family protein [Alphaproteobacteria bacterium]|nr:septum formation initiator family protein [Alphaproteobacteria bacterium]
MRFRLFPILCLLVIAYFSYHTVWGNRGFFRLLEIREQIAEAKSLAQEKAQEKKTLQYKTSALKNPKTIDPDILEEEALRVLGQTHSDNLVIFD